jgi:hypothetical protein
MSCEGGECKVQIFDVRVTNVTIKSSQVESGLFGVQKNPTDNICHTNPTADQIAQALRKRPIWLTRCPNPKPPAKPECDCIFIEDDLDPKKGWTLWTSQPVPTEAIEIPGADGPDKPQQAICKYNLAGTFQENAKILHGVCLASSGGALPKQVTEALEQRNPKDPA